MIIIFKIYIVGHGVKIKNVHNIVCFNKKAWLKKYIDFNTEKRQARNEFEKDFFRLMNNSVFGKTMENVENRIICILQITSLMP